MNNQAVRIVVSGQGVNVRDKAAKLHVDVEIKHVIDTTRSL